jgi:ribosomal-protein-alanine N-acetyltransferase
MEQADVEQVFLMEQAYFSMPWSRQALMEAAVGNQTFYMVAADEAKQKIIAYCGMYCIMNEGDINQVAVHEDYRKMGIGKKLLQDFMQQGAQRGIDAYTLEVRVSNTAAIRLYEACGFIIEGKRKNFYEKPVEDAYIMWKR